VHLVEGESGVVSQTPTRADVLFAELDGRDIALGSSHWLACVQGIHTERDEAWVQLSLVGKAPCSVVVHLLPSTTAREAIVAIASWLDSRNGERSRILEVN
jgi:hypothetical protein